MRLDGRESKSKGGNSQYQYCSTKNNNKEERAAGRVPRIISFNAFSINQSINRICRKGRTDTRTSENHDKKNQNKVVSTVVLFITFITFIYRLLLAIGRGYHIIQQYPCIVSPLYYYMFVTTTSVHHSSFQ